MPKKSFTIEDDFIPQAKKEYLMLKTIGLDGKKIVDQRRHQRAVMSIKIEPEQKKQIIQEKRRDIGSSVVSLSVLKEQVVEVTVKLETSLKKYEKNGGDKKFIHNVSQAMKVDKSMIEIVSKRSGSVILDLKVKGEGLESQDDIKMKLKSAITK